MRENYYVLIGTNKVTTGRYKREALYRFTQTEKRVVSWSEVHRCRSYFQAMLIKYYKGEKV